MLDATTAETLVREALRTFRNIDAGANDDLSCQAQLKLDEALTPTLTVSPSYPGSDEDPDGHALRALPGLVSDTVRRDRFLDQQRVSDPGRACTSQYSHPEALFRCFDYAPGAPCRADVSSEGSGARQAGLPGELFCDREVPWQAIVRGHLLAALSAVPDDTTPGHLAALLSAHLPKASARRSQSKRRDDERPTEVGKPARFTSRGDEETSLSARYSAAIAQGRRRACPIEAGTLGRLAADEFRHGRLPFDRTAACGCWPQ